MIMGSIVREHVLVIVYHVVYALYIIHPNVLTPFQNRHQEENFISPVSSTSPPSSLRMCPVNKGLSEPNESYLDQFIRTLTEQNASARTITAYRHDTHKFLDSCAQGVTTLQPSDVERYIEGRELYVGILGNGHLHVLPVWELKMDNLPEDTRRIATERVKWSRKYQDKYGITSEKAKNLPAGKARSAWQTTKSGRS